MAKTIAVIPDTQCRPDESFEYLNHIGKYLVDKKPDIWVHLGDFLDFESLSSYDKGTKNFEGRRIIKDLDSGYKAMEALMAPLFEYNQRARKNKEKQYKPELHITLGNHCDRLTRIINEDPKLEGLISMDNLPFAKFGWTVHPFLQPLFIDNIAFCHYFPSGVLGRPATTASALVSKMHMSCIAGHQQGKQVAYGKRPDGSTITCIIAGSCYIHDEKYLDFQSNKHWRGIIFLHEVNNGSFDEMFVSLDYLKKRYNET